MADHEERIQRLEGQVSDMRVAMADVTSGLKATTETTQAIKADTAELVSLMKGGKVFGKVVAWTAGLGSAAVALWHMKDGFK